MRLKLKYVLPLAQMALAVLLLWWNDVHMRAAERVMHMPGPTPAFFLLRSINAPVALPRTLWAPYLSSTLDNVTFIAVIGIFWYWIALNIQSWRERRTLHLFAWVPLRVGVDLFVVAMGGYLVWLFIERDPCSVALVLSHLFVYLDPRVHVPLRPRPCLSRAPQEAENRELSILSPNLLNLLRTVSAVGDFIESH
jgi:hypothetical protein